jgi:uncharacterized protein YgiM (DUF1202 family)
MKSILPKTVVRRLRGASCFALLFVASEIAWAQSADVQRAIDAYNEGDYAAAMAVWEPLANQGNRDAQFAMGVLYYEGHGVNKNLDEALAWFRKAADSEHPTAMFNLGVAYWEGRGLSQNYAQAVDWWERAAESGDVASQYNLGLAYYLGKGAQKDLDQARNWLTQAAEKGHADAQRVLGIIDEKYTKSQTASSATSDTSTASATNQAGSAEVESVTVQPAEQYEAQAQSASEPSSGQASNATTPEVPTKVTTTTKQKAAASSVIITTRFRAAEVSVDGLELRSGPSSQSPVLQTLRQATPVKIVEARGSWGRVEIPGQVRLWVFGDYVQGTPEGRITANKVRLRNRPTTGENSKVVAHLNKGDSVTVHTSTGDWKQISSRKATPAWVRLSGVSEQNPVTQDWLDNFNALAKAQTVKTKPASASSTPSAFRAAWVRGDNTAVFGRAAPDAPKLNDLARDLPVKVIGSKGDWLMIESPIGLDVWVYGKFISETGNTAQINNNRVRIRSLPSTGPESDVLGLLDKGTPVEIKSRQGDWIRLRVTRSIAGWVASDRLTTPGSVSADWQKRWDDIRSQNQL